ncbi:uncharacterized protein N7484_007463 [Penicillium longicatenatum]|uniref:uncharacterized protein n=1 Tax=Penicillium longicatenatum TaxID=1561947 RepID=UPI0025496AF8|nr:uncharacterized protein N7484_007463 [Penicillium longicatenatum]KAJ5639601.1 hypothetical protein N7484_007463 [Penicillium longicatenatum]
MQTRAILLGTSHPHIFHRFAYLKENNVTVIGYYDSDEHTATRMQRHSGCPRYSNCMELLSLDFDTVLIHGRDNENARYIRLAINSGAKAIFLEKPGVAHPDEFHDIATEIRDKSIIFEVGWELHYLETVKFARDILQSSLLGYITEARFHGGCPGGAGAEPWQSYKDNIGGFFYSLGGHVVEVVIDLFGLPSQVVSSIRKLPEQKPHRGFSWVPDLFNGRILNPEKAVGTLVHEDLASAILEYETMNVHLDFNAWEPSGYLDDWTIDIYGIYGSLHLGFATGGHILMKEARQGWKVGRNEICSDRKYQKDDMLKAAFNKQMDSFFGRSQNGIAMDVSCDETAAQKLLLLFHALYTSAQTRSWVTMSR